VSSQSKNRVKLLSAASPDSVEVAKLVDGVGFGLWDVATSELLATSDDPRELVRHARNMSVFSIRHSYDLKSFPT